MISYCIVCYRTAYAKLLIEELESKTTCLYEILLWLNTDSPDFLEYILSRQMAGVPIRVMGITPENIGMHAFKNLFQAARYDIITQIDDDVIRVSSGIAEQAAAIFARHPQVQQIVADVWQDNWTNGSRPPLDSYTLYDAADGLYSGRIDGWFSMYKRSMLPTLMEIPYANYLYIGFIASQLLSKKGLKGLLCTRFKVLHLAGPHYAFLFDQLESEISKYRSVGRNDLADSYELAKAGLPPIAMLQAALQNAYRKIDALHHQELQNTHSGAGLRHEDYGDTHKYIPE